MTGVVFALLVGALFFILGVSWEIQIEIVMLIVIVVLAAMCLFFMASVVMLALSKRKSAVFDGIEKDISENENTVSSKAEFAYYLVDGSRVKNIFPAEKAGRNRIYTQGSHNVFVFTLFKKPKVIDRHSVVIIVCGMVMSAASLVFAANIVVLGG